MINLHVKSQLSSNYLVDIRVSQFTFFIITLDVVNELLTCELVYNVNTLLLMIHPSTYCVLRTRLCDCDLIYTLMN